MQVDGRNIYILLTTAGDEERGDYVDAMFDENGEETFDIASAVEVACGNEIHILGAGDSLEIQIDIQ